MCPTEVWRGNRQSPQANPCWRPLLPGSQHRRSGRFSGLSAVVIVVMAPGSPWLQNPGWQGRQGQPPPQSESPRQSPPRGCPPICKVSTHEFSTGLPCEISGPQHLLSLLQALPGGTGGTLGSWLQGRGGESSRCPARVRTVRAAWY